MSAQCATAEREACLYSGAPCRHQTIKLASPRYPHSITYNSGQLDLLLYGRNRQDCNFFFVLCVCFTSYFVFSVAVLPHSPGVVYYHLLLRQETRIPGVAPFSFQIGIWDLFVHRGQKSHTPTAMDRSRSKMH